nr:immunoglobulin light chain junction region [Macaca mulatta]
EYYCWLHYSGTQLLF